MYIEALSKIYNQARNVGAVANAREFSSEFLGQNENYYAKTMCLERMTPPWTTATLLTALRALRAQVGAAARPDIESLIADVEHGLAVATRYRYR